MKSSPQLQLLQRARSLELELEKALEQRAAAEQEAEMANARLAALARLFPGASSLHEARLQFDGMGVRAAAGSQGKISSSTDE
jgi:hypothetical protein